jgi:Winged helix-turn helix
MPQIQTRIHIELTTEERTELERIARAESLPHRAVVRARVVLGLVDGGSVSAIARQVCRQRRIVRKWADRFGRKRLRGLDDAPRGGRPAHFPPSRRRAPGEAGVRAA